jgi:nicotinamide riboside kinase
MNQAQTEKETRQQPTRRPRLALTGSAGVGKTTLGRLLAERFNVPFIAEGMRSRLEAGLDPHALGRDGFRKLLLELFEEMFEATGRAVETAGGFVSDRSSIDCAAFWLYYGYAADADTTAMVFEHARRVAQCYDLIIVLPWDGLPLIADGVRSPNRWLQLHYQALLEGLLAREISPERMPFLPTDVDNLDDRAAWVYERLNEIATVSGWTEPPS